MPKKIRVVGYVRVSTEEQAKEGFSLDNQRKDIEKLCEYQGWELVKTFDDEGISGSTIEERPGVIEALKYVKEEKVDFLIVWKLSRLSRKMSDIVQIADYLSKNNIALYTIKDGIDTSTPMGKPFLYFAGIFAELERDSLIVQVRGGMEEKARKGEWNGGKPPLGYDLIDKKLVVNIEEADIVKLIFTEYLKGAGYLAIVDILKDRGYTTKRGNSFSGNAVKEILKNPTYAGRVRWGYRQNWGKKEDDGKRKRKYSDEAIEVKGIHEYIIDEKVFDKVQAMIKNNPRHHLRRFQGFHLLSGLVRCPDCGQGMSYQPVSSQGKKYHYYVCNQYMNHKTCKPNSIKKEEIEKEFFDILERMVEEPSFRNDMVTAASSSDKQIVEIADKIKRKQKDILKLEKERDSLIGELEYGTDSYKELLRGKIQEKLDKEKEFKSSIVNDEIEIKELRSRKLDIGEIIGILEKTGKVIKLLEKEAQQTLIRKLISSIKVKDKHIKEVHFTFGNVLGLDEEQGTVP